MEFIYHFNNLFNEPLICNNFDIYQVGELLANQDTVVMDHYQYCYEITFVLSGSGSSVTDKFSTPITADDCYISFPDEWHRINSDKDSPLRYRFVGFNSKDEKTAAMLKELRGFFDSPENRLIRCPDLRELFVKLLNEMTPSAYNDVAVGAIMTEMLVAILRACRRISADSVAMKITNKNMLVYHVSFYIENNILKLTGLSELCNIFHYSYQYIARSFYQITKKRLLDFFIAEKIKTAKHLLETRSQTVTEISETLHYSCTHAFTRMFKKHTGITPKQYQLEFLRTKEGKQSATPPLPRIPVQANTVPARNRKGSIKI